MNKQAQAQSPLDTLLQTKLVAKFGTKMLRRECTAVPVVVQRHYRSVAGEVIDGEIRSITPMEYMRLGPSVKEVDA